MSPNNEQSDLRLPAPSYSEVGQSRNNEAPAIVSNDQAFAASKPANLASQKVSGAAPTLATPQIGATSQDVPAQGQSSLLSGAGQESIEPFAIKKLEQIIAQTRGNPHMEAQEIYKLKNEFLKLKFGKELKSDH